MRVVVEHLIKQMEEVARSLEQCEETCDLGEVVSEWAQAVEQIKADMDERANEASEAGKTITKAVAAIKGYQLYERE